MDQIYLVYKTDAHHSYFSRDVIEVADSINSAVDICKQQAKIEHEKLKKDQLFNLYNIKQTQGYSGSGEFQFEELQINTLL